MTARRASTLDTMAGDYSAVREKDLLAQIVQLAKMFGWRYYHTFNAYRSAKGFPDMVLVRPPRLIFAELKSEKGKTTPEQDAWLAGLRLVAECHYQTAGFECLMEGRHSHGDVDLGFTVDMHRPEIYLWRPHDLERIAEVLR